MDEAKVAGLNSNNEFESQKVKEHIKNLAKSAVDVVGLAEKSDADDALTLSNAKAYTDEQVDGLATTAAMQAGDQKSLTDAKTYTDEQVAGIDPLPAGGTDGQVLTKTSEGSAWAASAPHLVQLVTDGWMLGAADGEDVPLGTLGQITNTSFVNSNALLIRSSLRRWSSWSILRGHVKMSKSWLNGKPYPEVRLISFGASQSESRVVNFYCKFVSTDTVNWDWFAFVPDDVIDMSDRNDAFFNRWADALDIEPTTNYTHPETGEVGTLYPLTARDVDVPDYGGLYNDDELLANTLTINADRILLVRTAK